MLFEPVSASTLGIFRLLFGTIMVHEFYEFYIYFSRHLIHSKFLIQHDGFGWLEMLPEQMLAPFFIFMMLSALLFALGIHYRFNSIVISLGFAYVFFIDRGHYNNHFYLYTIILFLFTFVDASWGSLARKRSRYIPYWMLFIFKLQIFVVYFYGGIAKLDLDWLQGYPLRYWLVELTQDSEGLVRSFYHSDAGALFFSISGTIFDLLVGFGLFSRRFRRISVVVAILFHLHNEMTFSIGSFPTAMICALIIYANPDKGNEIIRWFKTFKSRKLKINVKYALTWVFRKSPSLFNGVPEEGLEPFYDKKRLRRISLSLITVWFFIQFILPFRHFVYKGDPAWTGEGHLFAWRMMLVDTTNGVRYFIVNPETGQKEPVDILYYVTWRQFFKMSRTPKTYVKFAHFLADEIKKNSDVESPVIKMEIIKSVNERPPRLLNDTTLNYAEVEAKSFGHADWITKWDRTEDTLAFDKDRFLHWQKFIHAYNGYETSYQE